jgi:hypothetical protein
VAQVVKCLPSKHETLSSDPTTSKRPPQNRNLLSFRSRGQKYEVDFILLKSRCQQGCIPLGDSRGKYISLPSLAFSDCQHALLGYPSIFKSCLQPPHSIWQFPSLWHSFYFLPFVRQIALDPHGYFRIFPDP